MKSNAPHIRRMFNIGLVALATTVGTSALHAEVSQPGYETLLTKAQSQGVVRVIVRMKQTDEGGTAGAGRKSIQAQRAAIASLQSRVIAQLAKPAGVIQFKTTPHLAMEVDANDLATLRQSGEIESISEDRLLKPALAESTVKTGAMQAHAWGNSGAGQIVAILDSGVDKAHPDFAGKVVHEACFSFVSAAYGVSSMCPNGQQAMFGEGAAAPCKAHQCDHGTHVTGIAAGRKGVARDATIIAIQVFSQVNSQQVCGEAQAPCIQTWESADRYALEYIYLMWLSGWHNIAAVNMSLSGDRHTRACDTLDRDMTQIIDNLHSRGIATVIASGNEGYTDAVGKPGCISNAVTVGGTDKLDGMYQHSNSSQQIDLLAPGVDITSAIPDGRYASFTGTSMAAPHVAGAFAVLKQSAPQADVDTLLGILKSTGKPVMDPRNNLVRPRIQIDAALKALAESLAHKPAVPQLSNPIAPELSN